MARRYARVLSVDRGYMIFAVALPIILGLLLRIIPSRSASAARRGRTRAPRRCC